MKKIPFLVILAALLLALCACVQGQTQPDSPTDPPDIVDQPQTPVPDAPDPAPDSNSDSNTPVPITLEELTMELVVEWETADALLSQLDELAVGLQTALDEADCRVDRVTITISTAGGFTAQSLAQGGVDAAILPALDFISYENQTAVIALSDDALSETAIAVSKADRSLTEAFHAALYHALTQTESGQELLSLCCPDTEFSPPTEAVLQLVRDRLAELNENEGGHA